MAGASIESLRHLSDDADYYVTALDLYNRESRRVQRICEWVDGNLHAMATSMDVTLQKEDSFSVLSVGAGDGIVDHRILGHLRDSAHPQLRAVILEPDSHMMQQYQDLVSKESTKLQGVDLDWRQQTFQEFQATAKEDDKFHFISCINSLYYCGDLEKSLKFLYEKLDSGGLLLITILSAEGGLGKLWQHLSNTSISQRQFTSCYLQETCKKQNIPIAEMQKISIQCDISPCFDHQLSQDGNTLLDFLTHTVNFAQNAPAEYRDDVLRFLGSPECSVRGSGGKVILDASNVAVLIRKQ
ncbi:histamine N-methyltransferase A-like [Patiria miniata]|uniref:Histamine N-methyltransferase n=1 Tax=Patiria miniata TaxID=46514 RepID=A0A913ZW47_PATMI|nr:histamine N-methyltransferase A-like [Patiria miniata]